MSNLPLESFRWQAQNHWSGGLITCIAAHGSLCLAGTMAGLFRSVDAGKTWARVNGALGYEAAQAIALMDGCAFAATQAGRLLQSNDTGATWQPIASWQYGVVQCLACANTQAGDLALFVGTADGVYRSLDAGESWQEANFGLLDTDVLCLACAPDFADSEIVWLGTAQGGLYRSRNAGRAWRESGDGLEDAAVLSITLSANFAQDRTLLLGMEERGLFRSTDGGLHWEAFGLDGHDVHAVLSIGADGAWVVVSSDGVYEWVGQSSTQWQPLTQIVGATSAALAHADDAAGVLIVGTINQGAIQMRPGPAGWQVANGDGIVAHIPPLVAATPSGTRFALDNTGLLVHRHAGGAAWVGCPFDEDLGEDVPKLLSAWGNDVVVLVGTHRLYRWATERGTFMALVDVPVADNDEVTVVTVSADHTIWVGSRNGHLQRWWPTSGLWETIPAPVEGLMVGLHGAVDGADVTAVMIRSATDGRYAAELWQLTQSTASQSAWTMVLALDHLSQPFACAAMGASPAPAMTIALAGQNMLAIHSANASARLVDLGADTRITAVLPFEAGWCVATNHGVCFVTGNEDARIWSLDPRPVVALLNVGTRLQAVTLGGEIWTL